MKKTACLIYCALAAISCVAQPRCKNVTPVDKVAVFTELSDNGKLPKFLSLIINSDTVSAKLSETEKCYLKTLDAKVKMGKNDLKPPVIKNYAVDPDQPVQFLVQAANNECRAEYQFSYLPSDNTKKYKLEIAYSSKNLAIDDIPEKDKPVSITVEAGKKYIEVTAVYGADWRYYFKYKIKDYEGNLNEPLMHYASDIKKLILDNPSNPITDPIARNYIMSYPLGEQLIRYTLSKVQ